MYKQILSFQKEKNISVVQFMTSDQNLFEYISGTKAIANNLIQIKEINESGSVNDLYVLNPSNNYIFFMDGDILEGAKQNRVLNTSVLLAPNSKTIIPVSCIERGRWHNQSDLFSNSADIAPSKLREKKARSINKNMEEKESAYADQNQVWDEVVLYCKSFNVDSATDNLSDVLKKEKSNTENHIDKFKINSNANGIAIFVNNNLTNLELFNRSDIYTEYFTKILKSVAIESVGLQNQEKELTKAEATFKTLSLIDTIESIDYKEYPGIGVGRERRFENEKLTGFQLDYNDVLIHLNALRIEKVLGDG